MSRATKIFNPQAKASKPSATAPIVNRDPHGYPAWERPLEEQFLQTVLTNTLGNTYYVKQQDLIAESQKIHQEMLDKDPDFYAKGLVYARNKGYMRLQPVYGLALLSAKAIPLFERIFAEIILTPNDLSDFMGIVASMRKGSQGGRAIKRAAGNWLTTRLSQYWAIKYGSGEKKGYSLNAMLRTLHPKAGDDNLLMAYLLGHTLKEGANWPEQIEAFEALKRAKTDEEKIKYITEGRLPHEVATSFAGSSKAVWNAIVPQLPVFALLRNLATLERHDVLDENRKVITDKLNNRDVIKKSKIFPYQFLRALENVKSAWAKDAIRKAVDYAFDNIPDITGKTVVAVDFSGSMAGDKIQTASIFGISLMRKANLNGKFLLFDTELLDFPVSMEDSILSQADTIQARGGTNTALPLDWMNHVKYQADNLIVITDEQQNAGTPFADVLKRYHETVNRDLKTFIVDISAYRTALTPDWPNTYFIYGWSDQVLSFISMASQGWGSMVDVIRAGASYERTDDTKEQTSEEV